MTSLRREILAAYFAGGSRVLSWVFVTAIVYRVLGADNFALLALVRTTVGLLNYTTLGLAPAMVRLLAIEKRSRVTSATSEVYSSALCLAAIIAIVGAALAFAYGHFFSDIHNILPAWNPTIRHQVVPLMGLGMVFRIVSDAPGAVLQVRGQIALDNLLLAAAELIWIALVALSFTRPDFTLTTVAMWWSVSGLLLLGARGLLAHEAMGAGSWSPRAIRLNSILALLSFGLLVALAQAADFLYAPTDNILINRFIDPLTVAVYAPAIQIDAGLLLLVGGLAAVLLPRSALAHAGGDTAQVRRYYRKGTAFSIALLLPAALLIWLLAPHIFRLWLNDSMPATTAILPLVLIHTVVGGSSAVGRSVLLAVGKVKPFTTAVLIAGVANVILSFAFVYYGHLGLRGIILGTIIAVVGRCGVWMPWYVNRVLKNPSAINVV